MGISTTEEEGGTETRMEEDTLTYALGHRRTQERARGKAQGERDTHTHTHTHTGPASAISSRIYPETLELGAAVCPAGFLLKANLQMSIALTAPLSAPLLCQHYTHTHT